MQETAVALEREAARQVPAILADLLDEPMRRFDKAAGMETDVGFRVSDDEGRTWAFEVKASSGPAVVARAAEQLERSAGEDAIAVLVVPYMSSAGAKAAADRDVNWLDLSGNAHIRAENLYLSRTGRPDAYKSRGRPASPFAPKSARVTRTLLIAPQRWWRQKDLAESTRLDDGQVSRIVGRLDADRLLERDGALLRPRDPALLLDAWADDYRFDRHDTILGHVSGGSIEVARDLSTRLTDLRIDHALTGLPAAWLLDGYAGFRLTTIYVQGDPRGAAEQLELRREARGANVQLIGPEDEGVLAGGQTLDGLPVVAPVQTYLDLLHLPERAREAAEHLRAEGLLWPA